MAFLSKGLLAAILPILLLKRKKRLLAKRVEIEKRNVDATTTKIIKTEEQGFWHDEIISKEDAEYQVHWDHARAEPERDVGECGRCGK
jgi:hypothetical protein